LSATTAAQDTQALALRAWRRSRWRHDANVANARAKPSACVSWAASSPTNRSLHPCRTSAASTGTFEIRSTSSRSGETDTALANQGEGLKRESVNTDRSSEWADGLRIEDSTGSLLLNPIGGRMDTTRGAQLNKGLLELGPNERIHEIVRTHGGGGVEAEASSVQERFLEHGANVVAEGVVEDIKGRLFLGARRPLLARASRRNRPAQYFDRLARPRAHRLRRAVRRHPHRVVRPASLGQSALGHRQGEDRREADGSWRGSKDKSPIFFR